MKKVFISISSSKASAKLSPEVKAKRKEIIEKLGLKHSSFGNYYDENGEHYKFEKNTAKLIDQGKKRGYLKRETVKSAAAFLKEIKASPSTTKGRELGLNAALLGMSYNGRKDGGKEHSFNGSSAQAIRLIGKAKREGVEVKKHTDGSYVMYKENGKPFAQIKLNKKDASVRFV
jgi:hypothetical protein